MTEPPTPKQEDSVIPNEEVVTSTESTLIVDSGEMMLALSRNRDEESNRQSTPPDGELVSFRSLTLADVFAGSGVDDAVRSLSALEWAEDAADVSQEVGSALLGYKYYRHVFWIRGPGRNPVFPGVTQAWACVPDGVDRIYGDVNVLGPSLVVVVLTFVFTESIAVNMDRALHVDGESQLTRRGSRFGIRDARGEKKDRVWAARDDVSVVCQDWASVAFPGTLSQVTEGFGRPTCGLVTLARGTPFATHEQYMAILELVNDHLAYSFVNHEYLFWSTRTVGGLSDNSTVVFNESAALSPGGLDDLDSSPEVIHETISSMMVADAIYRALASFGPHIRDFRKKMIRIDLNTATTTELAALRTTLLKVSGELAALVSDTRVLVEDPFAIWADLEDIRPLRASGGGDYETTVSAKKRILSSTADGLHNEERGIQDQLLTLTQAKSEATNTRLQGSIRALTIWLVVLTIVLLALGIATLIVQMGTAPSKSSPNSIGTTISRPWAVAGSQPLTRGPPTSDGAMLANGPWRIENDKALIHAALPLV